jgi:branched-chain amino acid transport system permease protein
MKRKDLQALLIIATAVGIFPWAAGGNQYFVSLLVFLGLNAITTLGLTLLMGYAGQISLGHAAFLGIGAYCSGILTVRYGLHPSAAFFLGICLSAGIAFVVGRATLRLKGHYMAVATLGFGEIVSILFNELSPLTGGPSGLSNIPPLVLWGYPVEGIPFFYVVWGVFFLLLAFSLNLVNSRVGRALRAIHGSELAAGAMGVDAARAKLQVFVLSAVYASMSGSLYAHFLAFISPNAFGLMFSILLLMMVVIGGSQSLWGGLVGAAILTLLPEYLRALEDFEVLAYGAILLSVLLFMPQGVLEGMRRIGVIGKRRGTG